MKIIIALAMLAFSGAAMAQDAPPPDTATAAPPLAVDFCNNLKDVPLKARGMMLMALRDGAGSRTMEIPYTTARACEEERCRIKATVAAQCIWVK